MAQTFLIDADGEIELAPKQQLVAGGQTAPILRLRSEIVQIGHIVWVARQRDLSIYFRPAVTNKRARQRILSWLTAAAPQRIHIAYWAQQAWRHEICGSTCSAKDRIDQIFIESSAGDDLSARRRIKRPRDVEKIGPFKDAISFWNDHAHQFEPDLHFRALSKIASGAANLFHVDGPGCYVPVELRNQLSPAFAKWFRMNRGAPISAFPDGGFSRSVTEAFSSSQASSAPLADEVDTFARWPGQYSRLRYHRLVLPFQRKHERWIVSMSIFDDDIDLHI